MCVFLFIVRACSVYTKERATAPVRAEKPQVRITAQDGRRAGPPGLAKVCVRTTAFLKVRKSLGFIIHNSVLDTGLYIV